jgi:oligopeptidase B
MSNWLIPMSLGLLLTISCARRAGTSGIARETDSGRDPFAQPVAKIAPRADTLHGDVRIDPYYWMRDRENPEVIEYLEAENVYTESMMAHTEELQGELYEEMVARMKETDLTVPERFGDYYYYSRTEEGEQYRIYCRKKGDLEAPEEIILDLNELAAGHDYLEMEMRRMSPNHRYLAYAIDTVGSEYYTIYVKDLEKGIVLDDVIPGFGYTLAWADDNRSVFYTTLDAARRPHRLCRHELGTNPGEDVLIYEEPDEMFWVSITRSRSGEYLFLETSSRTSSEIYYLEADHPEGEFELMYPREPEMEYYVDHTGGRFFLYTNDDAENFRLMEAPLEDPSRANWREVIPHRNRVKIENMDVFENHVVLYEREEGQRKIHVLDHRTGEIHDVPFPEQVYTFWRHRNPEFHTNLLRFTYTSFVTPNSVFDYDLEARERTLMKEYEVRGGYDRTLYDTERCFARAEDDTLVPISIVYRKDMREPGGNPLVLEGYGAYGISWDPYFSSRRLSLLDRGFIYVFAHVRGGGEKGEAWYDQGKLLNKMNTFTDFISCAEYLIGEGYTTPEQLVAYGGSAGGLLVGAVLNMRPDLFGGALAGVPFVDALNTMLDPTIPLTVLEYDEWGDPNDPEYYFYMKRYSPYDNVVPQDYPPILIEVGLNDSRVQYWEGAKWAAKLRALKTDDNILLLKTEMGAGHLGVSGRYDWIREIAFEYAWLLDLFGITE